jgi:hypothetical protein
MKRLYLALVSTALILMGVSLVSGQTFPDGNVVYIEGTSDPVGSCIVGTEYYRTDTGTRFTCADGTWSELATGGGSSYDGGSVTNPFLAPDGTAALPGYAFTSDPSMGWYRTADAGQFVNYVDMSRAASTNASQGRIWSTYTRDEGPGATRQYWQWRNPQSSSTAIATLYVKESDRTRFQLEPHNGTGGSVTIDLQEGAFETPGNTMTFTTAADGDYNKLRFYTTDSVTGDGVDVISYIEFMDNVDSQYVRLQGPSDPSGTNIISVPNLTGDMLVGGGGATQYLSSGTAIYDNSLLIIGSDNQASSVGYLSTAPGSAVLYTSGDGLDVASISVEDPAEPSVTIQATDGLTLTNTITVTETTTTFTDPLLLPDGTEALPALAFTNATDTGIWKDTGFNEVNVSADGFMMSKFQRGASTSYHHFYNTYNGALDDAFRITTNGSYQRFQLYVEGTSSDFLDCYTNPSIDLGYCEITTPSGDASQLYFKPDGTDTTDIVWGISTGNPGNPVSGNYVALTGPVVPTGTNTVTLPDLTGTVLVSGATNANSSGTTVLSYDANKFFSYSNNDVKAQWGDGTGSYATTWASGVINTTANNGTDFTQIQQTSTAITLDADGDNDADGTVTLTTANDTASLTLNSTAATLLSPATRIRSTGAPTALNNIDSSTTISVEGLVNPLTESTATTMLSFTPATGDHGGGTFQYTVFAEDATDHQVRTGTAQVSFSNKGGTLICNATVGDEGVVVSSGTLTCTPDCNVSSTTAQLRLDCTSSLTQTTLEAWAGIAFHGGDEQDVSVTSP